MLEVGQRVQIKDGAFYGSTDEAEINARGQTGELLRIEQHNLDGDHLWHCRCDDGSVVAPLETELEVLENNHAN